MVKGIILDVDGVIVGDKPGVNFPFPNSNVIEALFRLHQKGMPIILCTAKFGYAIIEIIENAALNNPHVTDGGALIINPLEGEIIIEHLINKEEVANVVVKCLENNIYTELYTAEDYFLQKDQQSEFTYRRTELLSKAPILVDSFLNIAANEDIIKVICFARKDHEVEVVSNLAKEFGNRINFIWSAHPFLPGVRSGVITAPGVSKANAVREALESLSLTFDEMLGVGDSLADWNFMQYCKYAATLENGDEKLKELIREKGDGNYLIAPHINENGIFEILKYFL